MFQIPITSIAAYTLDRSMFLLSSEKGYLLYELKTNFVRSVDTSVGGGSPGYSWSPSGGRLAVTAVRDDPAHFEMATYVVDVQTGKVEDVIEWQHRDAEGNFAGPIWLGENQFLIQETLDQGPLLATVGQGVVQVAPELFGLSAAPMPTGAPDSSVSYLVATGAAVEGTDTYHIILSRHEPNTIPPRLYHSETGEVEELRFEQMPEFSPDGRWLALSQAPTTKADQYLKLWLQPVDPPGSEARIVLRTDAVSSDVKWAADWTKVAVGMVNGISVFSFPDGAHVRAWRTEPYSAFPQAWSPNNEFLATIGLVFGSGDHEEALFVVQVP